MRYDVRSNEEFAREGITFRQWEVLAWSTSARTPLSSRTGRTDGDRGSHAGGNTVSHGPRRLVGTIGLSERPTQKAIPADRQGGSGLGPHARVLPLSPHEATEGLTGEELAAFKRTCEMIRQNLGQESPTLARSLGLISRFAAKRAFRAIRSRVYRVSSNVDHRLGSWSNGKSRPTAKNCSPSSASRTT